MKQLQADKTSGDAIQVMEFSEDGFETITNAAQPAAIDADFPHVVLIIAVTEAAWIFGSAPSAPAALTAGHYMTEGMSYPVVIPAGKKIAAKGTIRISY